MRYERITESELVLPSLYLMNMNNGQITTTELIGMLQNLLHPSGKDLEIINNRKDSYFSQKVRNLKSHNNLIKRGLASYNKGVYYITPFGKEYLMQHKESFLYLFNADFDYQDIKYNLGKIVKTKKTIITCYSEIIEEGAEKLVLTKTHERSRKLRLTALEHFSHNGLIKCDCCGFEAQTQYGEYGKPTCIEMHHKKPIFQYAGVSVQATIDEALKNLLPVCPNCHRVIHKKHITEDKIPTFKKEIIALRQSSLND